jgi:glycogen debranching enzyme
VGDRLDQFFADLERSAPGRLPDTCAGIIRFDFVREGQTATWFVSFADGRVRVDRTRRSADCTVEMSPEAFERLLAGRDHTVAMLLRGGISVQGDLALFQIFRRLLPVRADTADSDPGAVMTRQGERSGLTLREATSIFYGSMFMISARNGDVEAESTTPAGLFFFDTRFLSTWRLTVDAERLAVLSIDDIRPFESKFAVVPGQPTHYVSATTSILRHRWLGETFEEEITLFNSAPEPVHLTVRLDVGADFAEVQEVKDGLRRERQVSTVIDEDALRVRYQRDTLLRETVVSASTPAFIDRGGFTFAITVAPQGTWTTHLTALPLVRDLRRLDLRERLASSASRPQAEAGPEIDHIVSTTPRLRGDHQPLCQAYRRSVLDLAALRYRGLNYEERLPATGLPWSMALLGRESIISSLQALPFLPERAVTTLRILALAQGCRIDPFRCEEPGKMLQESRYGESAAFNEEPAAADFSAADTTALFVILLDEYERWSGDAELARRYEFQARAAITWIDEYADLVGDGYVWSARRETRTGPINRSWKGSVNAICFHDGRVATFPQAICEIQGYTYDAKVRAARLARLFWNDPEYADRLEREAKGLRERFNRDFWMEERGYYALALQADGEQVDGLASNLGHLLWSGIVEPDRAERVAAHLVSPPLYSGWGVRTLASTEWLYSPLGYHTGAIWPADNSLIAWGLRRYGFKREAALIAQSIIEAGEYFGGRLPAVFAGYDRSRARYPVPHTFSDSPYAPSAGAALLMLRVLLGLEPHEDHLAIDAGVPEAMGQIELLDIPGRWGYVDALGRGRPFREHGDQGRVRDD